MTKIQEIQTILRVDADDIWGVKSQAALNELIGSQKGVRSKASSFADPADVATFLECKKKTGKSDLYCFQFGDNGIGQFGEITAQEHTPMCALHADDMKAKWGSVNAAAHREVLVSANGREVVVSVEDRMSAPGRIDLNPAAAKKLGLKPPFLVSCSWRWV